MHCSRRIIEQTLVFSHSYLHRRVSPPETLVVKGGTTWARNGRWILPESVRLPRNIQGSFTCRKYAIWGKRLYFSSEGRCAEDFFALKNRTVSVGFEPGNLGTICQHATSRSSKRLIRSNRDVISRHKLLLKQIQSSYMFRLRKEPIILPYVSQNVKQNYMALGIHVIRTSATDISPIQTICERHSILCIFRGWGGVWNFDCRNYISLDAYLVKINIGFTVIYIFKFWNWWMYVRLAFIILRCDLPFIIRSNKYVPGRYPTFT